MSIAHTDTIGARGGTVQEDARRTVRPAEPAIEKSTSAVIQNEQKIQMTTGKDADIVPRRNAHIADITTVMTATAATHTVIRKSPRGDIGAIHILDLAHPTDTEVSHGDGEAPPPEKEKPNFGNTGRLAAESNTVTVGGGTVVLKYHEPPEARKPPAKESWRLYVFKGKDLLEMVELNERSCWLIGRERLVVDFPLDHPSCSKQHAAIQFRFVEKRNEFGDRIGKVKPYVIDLESANGSKVNGELAPAGRYVELRDKDMLQFGLSSREYVLMLTQPD
ncbi:SMAD/FHA domain-containing protein [Aspergillus germanicus]